MESLQISCVNAVADGIYDANFRFHQGTNVHPAVCNAILQRVVCRFGLSHYRMSIFRDSEGARLDSVDFSYSPQLNGITESQYLDCNASTFHPLEDELIEIINRDLQDLNLLGISLTRKVVEAIGQHSHRLRSLQLKGSSITCLCSDDEEKSVNSLCCLKDYHPKLGHLQKLVLHQAGPGKNCSQDISPRYFDTMVKMMCSPQHLVELDVTGSVLPNLEFLTPEQFPLLQKLVLFNVKKCKPPENDDSGQSTALGFAEFRAITSLSTLRHLDVGRTCTAKDLNQWQPSPETHEAFEDMVHRLPRLEYLDISGTHLAGYDNAISWLEGLNLSFLGLLNCEYESSPCDTKDLPIDKVSGLATFEQVLTCLEVYATRPWLPHIINPLTNLLCFLNNNALRHKNTRDDLLRTMEIIVQLMEKNLRQGMVLYACCTCLSILLKLLKDPKEIPDKSGIVQLLLDIIGSTSVHKFQFSTFKVIVCALFKALYFLTKQEGSAIEVRDILKDLDEMVLLKKRKFKIWMGQLGGIKYLNRVIATRLQTSSLVVTHEVSCLSLAWSILQKVLAKMPKNVALFLREKGLQLFLATYKVMKNYEELIVTILCTMKEVVAMEKNRPPIRKTGATAILIWAMMTPDNFERCNAACFILACLLADGEDKWTYSRMSYREVDTLIENEVKKWQDNRARSVHFYTLDALKQVLACSDCPGAQAYSAWEIYNIANITGKGGKFPYLSLVQRDDFASVLREKIPTLGNDFTRQLFEKALTVCDEHSSRDNREEPGPADAGEQADDDQDGNNNGAEGGNIDNPGPAANQVAGGVPGHANGAVVLPKITVKIVEAITEVTMLKVAQFKEEPEFDANLDGPVELPDIDKLSTKLGRGKTRKNFVLVVNPSLLDHPDEAHYWIEWQE